MPSLLLLSLLSLLDLQLQLLNFVPYLCLWIRVSLDQDGCLVSICSLRVLLAPVPFSLSLSPTSPALAPLSLTSLVLASLPALALASLALASPALASPAPASLSPASLSLASLALASLAALAPASPALAASVQSAYVLEAPVLSASLNQVRYHVFAFFLLILLAPVRTLSVLFQASPA
jgi:hypothetical protein